MEQLGDFMVKGIERFSFLFSNPFYFGMLLLFLAFATYTDLKEMKIYNWFNLIVFGMNVVVFIVSPLLNGNYKLAFTGALGGLIGFAVLLIPAVATGFKMAGDIKFIGGFGLAVGGYGIVLFILMASILNLLTNLTLIKLKKKTLNNVVPFAPFFALSFIILTVISIQI